MKKDFYYSVKWKEYLEDDTFREMEEDFSCNQRKELEKCIMSVIANGVEAIVKKEFI